MACVPIIGKRKQYHFEAIVKLHSLISVPYVNAVTFAKLRLLGTRHSSQYSPRVEIRNHTVTWDTEHRFFCKFRSDAETKVLEPNVLKISIRMETKGGKSFYKVGFVSVNLACFTALGNVTSRRRYILEGYNNQHKRLDNSLLLVSFCMRQLLGDTCFRPPPENLSNCLVEPLDSDDGDYSTGTNPRGDKPGSIDLTVHDGLATSATTLVTSNPTLCPCSTTAVNIASINRILDSISSTSTDYYPSVQLSRPTSAHSASSASQMQPITRLESNAPSDPPTAETILRAVLQCTSEDRLPVGFSATIPSSQDQIVSLFKKVLASQIPLSDPIRAILDSYMTRFTTESIDKVPQQKDFPFSSTDNPYVQKSSSEHGADPVIPSFPDVDKERHAVRPELISDLSDAQLPSVCGDTHPSPVRAREASVHSSSSGTNASQSTTPGTTPGSSPFRCPLNPSSSVCGENVCDNNQLESDLSTQRDKTTELPATTYESFDSSVCHSLPLPPNYSSRRREAAALKSTNPPVSSRYNFPDHFATDSGLLLPSRRRKVRPMAQMVFPETSFGSQPTPTHQTSTLSSAYTSNSGMITELHEKNLATSTHPLFCQPPYRNVAPRNTCPSTGGDSRSSGYQSHSRQSSLESQPTGSSSIVMPAASAVSASDLIQSASTNSKPDTVLICPTKPS